MAKQHPPGFLALVSEAKTRVKECQVADVVAMTQAGDKVAIVDVREESEYAAGHIPEAIQLGKGVIERDIERVIPDPATKIVLYCGGGFRSALAADNIQKMGYRNVLSMDGGWGAWTQQGLPVAR